MKVKKGILRSDMEDIYIYVYMYVYISMYPHIAKLNF